MIENGQIRANIQILCLEHEIAVTIEALESILPQCRDDIVSVLLNGAASARLKGLLSDRPRVRYYESKQNFGVAGGRNFLLNTEEAKQAHFILFVDNDVIVPQDYVDRVCDNLSDTGIGVAGSIVLRYRSAQGILGKYPLLEGSLGCGYRDMQCADIVKDLRQSRPQNIFDHLGTNKDWRRSYFDDEAILDSILLEQKIIRQRTFFPSNFQNGAFVAELLSGPEPREVANVPGCCQAFRRSLVDRIGQLNDIFNPYGFEDVDFCYRAAAAGFKNIVSPRAVIFHGTDLRSHDRNRPLAWGRTLANEFRARTLLAFLHDRDRFPGNMLSNIVARFILHGIQRTNRQYEFLVYAQQGFKTALNQIAHSYPDAIARKEEGGFHAAEPSGRKLGDDPTGEGSPFRSDWEPFARYLHEGIDDSAAIGRNAPYLALGRRHTVSRRSPRSIERFKDLHAGERCFVIGNGPSLRRADLNMLRGETTFGVNGIFYMTQEMAFQPTYYLVEDNHVIHDNLEQINRVGASAKFFPDKYRDVVLETEQTYFLNTDWGFYFKSSPFFEKPRFSLDCAEKIFVGQTVTYLSLQLAYYMGFKEVFLIGMDFDYAIPVEAKVKNFTIESVADDPNHFHPEYFGKGKKWHFPKLENCLKAYAHGRTVYEGGGRRIVNATAGGKLEVFERMDFDAAVPNPVPLQAPNERLKSVFGTVLAETLKSRRRPSVAAKLEDRSSDPDWAKIANWLMTTTRLSDFEPGSSTTADLTLVTQTDAYCPSPFPASTIVLEVRGGTDAVVDSIAAAVAARDRLIWVLKDVLVVQEANEEAQLPLAGFADKIVRATVRRASAANNRYLCYVLRNGLGLGEWVWTELVDPGKDGRGCLDRQLLTAFIRKSVPLTIAGGALFARL